MISFIAGHCICGVGRASCSSEIGWWSLGGP